MTTQLEDPSDTSLAELIHQLVEDSRAVVRAELNLYRAIARYRVSKAKSGVAAVALGAVLLLVALIVLFVMVAQGLAVHVGPVGAGLVVALAAGGAGFLLLRYGSARVAVLLGDEEERTTLDRGEREA